MRNEECQIIEFIPDSHQSELVRSGQLIKSLSEIREIRDQRIKLLRTLEWEKRFKIHCEIFGSV